MAFDGPRSARSPVQKAQFGHNQTVTSGCYGVGYRKPEVGEAPAPQTHSLRTLQTPGTFVFES